MEGKATGKRCAECGDRAASDVNSNLCDDCLTAVVVYEAITLKAIKVKVPA